MGLFSVDINILTENKILRFLFCAYITIKHCEIFSDNSNNFYCMKIFAAYNFAGKFSVFWK